MAVPAKIKLTAQHGISAGSKMHQELLQAEGMKLLEQAGIAQFKADRQQQLLAGLSGTGHDSRSQLQEVIKRSEFDRFLRLVHHEVAKRRGQYELKKFDENWRRDLAQRKAQFYEELNIDKLNKTKEALEKQANQPPIVPPNIANPPPNNSPVETPSGPVTTNAPSSGSEAAWPTVTEQTPIMDTIRHIKNSNLTEEEKASRLADSQMVGVQSAMLYVLMGAELNATKPEAKQAVLNAMIQAKSSSDPQMVWMKIREDLSDYDISLPAFAEDILGYANSEAWQKFILDQTNSPIS